jgi:hypothetical protein
MLVLTALRVFKVSKDLAMLALMVLRVSKEL